jgi:hypothetical protein
VKDPVSFKDLHATEPGVYAGVAAEKYLAGHVTVAVHTCAHYIHSIHGDDFPGRMGGDDVFLDLRIGLNYYFSPYEGLIWGGSEEE